MELVQKLLSTRRGTIVLGGVAAGLSALVLTAYLNQYRNSVSADSEPITVLVAKRLIEEGMPGDVVGIKRLFEREVVPQDQLKEGAITDPGTLRGRIAVTDIYPGQPLTTADFAMAGGSIGTRLAGKDRAIAVPVDPAHGVAGRVEAGDRVDVLAGFTVHSGGAGAPSRPVIKVLMQNALVLEAPRGGGSGVGASGTTNVILRTDRDKAAQIAWAVDNGKVWLVLRPRAGSLPGRPGLVTDQGLLLGAKPTVTYRNVKKQLSGGGAR
jgi:pilus assembly protein CpaB